MRHRWSKGTKFMIKLRKFEETDISRLTGWIPDARFLRQWAGHQYLYPLDGAQLLKSIDRTRSNRPAHFMFTAFRQTDGMAVGHIELMSVDYGNGAARLGRVLIRSLKIAAGALALQ